jgi:hypothetical protein
LKHPIEQTIQSYGRVVLENTRRQDLLTQSVGETSIEGLISFKRGRTRVIGTQLNYKKDIFGVDHSGWATQATAALEGYNVLDIITVDRVVAQVTTDHAAENGTVPTVGFLGSTFENLRIGGFPVDVELDLDVCAGKPASGKSHLQDEGFLGRIERQLGDFRKQIGADRDASGALEAGYRDLVAKEDAEAGTNGYPKQRCSLVKKINLPIPIPGVKVSGNLISIAGFGVVALAVVEVGQEKANYDVPHRIGDSKPKEDPPANYFKLKMFKMYLGCTTTGTNDGPSSTANGHGGTGG